ncbi:hypothetical protein Bbelb_323260 [Branchiostoma belcheri]|nr:hypothetical protein Bbelb_323260 [Branchiostoma belcheri]
MLRKLLINCYQRQREEGERGRNAILRSKSGSATVGASGDAGATQGQREARNYNVGNEIQEEKMQDVVIDDDKASPKDEEILAKLLEESLSVEKIEVATTEEAIWDLLEQYGPK